MSSLWHYHTHLFQWHCRHFFKFRRHLSAAEKEYLDTCFRLAESLQEISESGYAHFSSYSYSHRVEGTKVNSSRLAYGSIGHFEAALQAARPVLAERGLALPAYLDDCRFYGLGWDFEESQFKVYYRCPDVARLPEEVRSLADLRAPHRPEGLVSYTYTDNRMSERKLYVYPPETNAGARMFTDRRGEIAQHDVQEGEDWAARLSPPGIAILERYRELRETLDTIAFQDQDHYTLYFP